ncbi:hypothetical protein QE152_g34297 [Popillia japonica]|uniref:HTH CENPB-type domain-containing protein n=1 Tax=Popillia japonica TaxID=7064 RepID=A0AAW1ITD4_POPJA
MGIEDNNQRQIPMRQMIIQENAKSIFEHLKRGDTDESVKDVTFHGRRAWFERFKNCSNLHNLKMKDEAASADDDAAKEYPSILKEFLKEMDIDLNKFLM